MHMLGTSPQPEGITNPPIDDLLEKVDSKYGLVVEAAKRARQINTYTQQLEDNQFEFFGPLVDSEVGEKSLGIALREIAEDKLEVIVVDDHSNDRSAERVTEMIEQLKAADTSDNAYHVSERIRFLQQPQNLGKRDAMARGVT